MDFSSNLKREGEILTYFLSGSVNEFCKLPKNSLNGVDTIRVDLNRLEFINSPGVGLWVEWMKEYLGKDRLVLFRHIHEMYVNQMNSVAGFLPKKYDIESFYVPYHVVDTDETHLHLAQKGKDFVIGSEDKPGQVHLPEEISLDGKTAELDIVPGRYFKFIFAE
jgi:hypothetical protein